MIKHTESHMDHGFTQAQWDHIFKLFADRKGFFNEIIGLPGNLGTVTNELYGPSCGDPPVPEVEVFYAARGDRAWNSRMTRMPKRPTCFVRVIAGPHDGHPCVLYTAYGVHAPDAAASPREPGDLRMELNTTDGLSKDPEEIDKRMRLHGELEKAEAFWDQHALASL